MKNNLTDLHNHLMAQIERLSDEGLSSDMDKLDAEIRRSKSMALIAGTAVNNGKLILEASKHLSEKNGNTPLPNLLTNGTVSGAGK